MAAAHNYVVHLKKGVSSAFLFVADGMKALSFIFEGSYSRPLITMTQIAHFKGVLATNVVPERVLDPNVFIALYSVFPDTKTATFLPIPEGCKKVTFKLKYEREGPYVSVAFFTTTRQASPEGRRRERSRSRERSPVRAPPSVVPETPPPPPPAPVFSEISQEYLSAPSVQMELFGQRTEIKTLLQLFSIRKMKPPTAAPSAVVWYIKREDIDTLRKENQTYIELLNNALVPALPIASPTGPGSESFQE